MSAEVAEAIRQTRRTLTERTWVPRHPRLGSDECCIATAHPYSGRAGAWDAFYSVIDSHHLIAWNDRQTDVGAVLGMTLQVLIAELCKGGAA